MVVTVSGNSYTIYQENGASMSFNSSRAEAVARELREYIHSNNITSLTDLKLQVKLSRVIVLK